MALLAVPALAKAEIQDASYFCTAEYSAGLAYDKASKRWVSSTFNPRQKFVLALKYAGSRAVGDKKSDAFDVTVTDAGSNLAVPCFDWSDPSTSPAVPIRGGNLRCTGTIFEYIFNRDSNRFLSIYAVGYIDGKDNNEDTPAISGGTCTKIN